MKSNPLNVAVVEDDRQQRELLVSELSAREFSVTGCADAAALWRHMTVSSCDLIVLDIGLPGEDGLSIADHLRDRGVGIVMLSGYTASTDQVRGLRGGADAYLTKPVDYGVLAATLESIGRRLRAAPSEKPADEPDKQPGGWRLMADAWKLCTPDRKEVILTAYERDMLRCLIRAGGRPTDRETLIGALTSEVHDFDPHRLEMVIYRLRRKIKAVTEFDLPLEAVRGVGYLINDIEEEIRDAVSELMGR